MKKKPAFQVGTTVRSAFCNLRKQGFVAGHFGDCQSCGSAEVDAKAQEMKAAGKDVSAYVFYHDQNREDAQRTGDLFLYFGTIEDLDDKETVETGKKVVAALNASGLETEWDETASRAIMVRLGSKEK